MQLLTIPETADLTRLSPVTLARWRGAGKGPPFLRLGGRVLYDKQDLVAWIREQGQTTAPAVASPSSAPPTVVAAPSVSTRSKVRRRER